MLNAASWGAALALLIDDEGEALEALAPMPTVHAAPTTAPTHAVREKHAPLSQVIEEMGEIEAHALVMTGDALTVGDWA